MTFKLNFSPSFIFYNILACGSLCVARPELLLDLESPDKIITLRQAGDDLNETAKMAAAYVTLEKIVAFSQKLRQ